MQGLSVLVNPNSVLLWLPCPKGSCHEARVTEGFFVRARCPDDPNLVLLWLPCPKGSCHEVRVTEGFFVRAQRPDDPNLVLLWLPCPKGSCHEARVTEGFFVGARCPDDPNIIFANLGGMPRTSSPTLNVSPIWHNEQKYTTATTHFAIYQQIISLTFINICYIINLGNFYQFLERRDSNEQFFPKNETFLMCYDIYR